MTIYLVTGTPGSGKSLSMAASIYWHVRMKRPVVANFDINRELFKDSGSFQYLDGSEYTYENLRDISKEYFSEHPFHESTLRLYWDECQIWLNSRDWSKSDRRDLIKFFTQHRKMGYDIYLITQFDQMLDKQIRALVEYNFVCRKLNQVGWVGKLASVLFLGHPVCVSVQYWYPQKLRVGSQWTIGRKRLYRLYDSMALFG